MLSVPSAASTISPDTSQRQGSPPAAPRAGARRRLWFFTTLSVVVGALGAAGAGSWSAARTTVSPHLHSGSPGYRQAPSGESLRWQRSSLTVYLDDSLTRIGPGATDAVTRAFGAWAESDSKLPNLSFDTAKTSAIPSHDGKSTVSYGRITTRGHERDLAITVSYADDKTGEIVEADIVLNSLYPLGVLTEKISDDEQRSDDKQRSDDSASNRERDDERDDERDSDSNRKHDSQVDECKKRYDVQNVATHEVGHFFGLGEDAVERDATMFQAIDECETHKRVLANTDVGAVDTLYASAITPEEAGAGPRACSVAFGSSSSGQVSAWSALLALGLGLARRRRPG